MNLLPQWTEKADKRGLDPLGIQNSGILLYQSLMPGISNVTLRIRYYGFYCWVAETYARRGASTDFEAWKSWVRRAEALYALVSAQAGEGGVGGIDWADRRLAEDGDIIDFAGAADPGGAQKPYLRQSLGVFGGAYYTQMAEMDLFTLNRHGIQVATRDLGKQAAAVFEQAIGPELAKLLAQKIVDGRVTVPELEKLAPITPSQIDSESDERSFYDKLLFAREEECSPEGRSRADTLLLILDTARAYGDRPNPEEVRWHLFDPPSEALPHHLEAQRLNWEAYQCQDLMQIASAALLAWAIAIINTDSLGRTLSQIHDDVMLQLSEHEEGPFTETWADMRAATEAGDHPFRDSWNTLTSARGATEDKAVIAVKLMAGLHRRYTDRSDLAQAVARGLPKRGTAYSLRTELDWLESAEQASVSERIADYVIERVVRRHSWVAMQKLRRQRDYTFLFEQREGRLVYLSAYRPVATTPRLAPAIQFLDDIHLLYEDGLTDMGLTVLESAL